jgi:hypothetical protein
MYISSLMVTKRPSGPARPVPIYLIEVEFSDANATVRLRFGADTKTVSFVLMNILNASNPAMLLSAKVMASGFQDAQGANRGWLKETSRMERESRGKLAQSG